MPLVPARFSRQSPPDVKSIFSPAASVRKSPAALRITPSWLVSSRIDRETANRSAVTENRRSDAVSNSRCRPHSAATASPWTATGADSAVGLRPDCRLRCQESIRAEGVDVSGSPQGKHSHARRALIVSFLAHDGPLHTHSELSEFLKRNNGSSQCKKRWSPGCAVPPWASGTTQIDSLRTWQQRQPSSSH